MSCSQEKMQQKRKSITDSRKPKDRFVLHLSLSIAASCRIPFSEVQFSLALHLPRFRPAFPFAFCLPLFLLFVVPSVPLLPFPASATSYPLAPGVFIKFVRFHLSTEHAPHKNTHFWPILPPFY